MPRKSPRGARPTKGGAHLPLFPAGIAAADYEISDERLVTHREVMIRSPNGRAPSVGDALTITRAGRFYDLTVLTVVCLGGDWSACCAASGA